MAQFSLACCAFQVSEFIKLSFLLTSFQATYKTVGSESNLNQADKNNLFNTGSQSQDIALRRFSRRFSSTFDGGVDVDRRFVRARRQTRTRRGRSTSRG